MKMKMKLNCRQREEPSPFAAEIGDFVARRSAGWILPLAACWYSYLYVLVCSRVRMKDEYGDGDGERGRILPSFFPSFLTFFLPSEPDQRDGTVEPTREIERDRGRDKVPVSGRECVQDYPSHLALRRR